MWDVEDSEGTTFDTEIGKLISSRVDGLGFCGCGNPEHAADMLCRYLEALDWAWEAGPNGERAHYWRTRWPQMCERAGLTKDAFMLCAYIADARGFTEHGGSIGGAWLQDKGRKFMVALRKALNEEAEKEAKEQLERVEKAADFAKVVAQSKKAPQKDRDAFRKTLEETPKEVLVSLIANMVAKSVGTNHEYVASLRLCESSRLALKPNLLYLFTVDENCQLCKEAASAGH